jgi:cation diffusion facilitator CzcD-associated flavoprotein CzcO
MNGVSQRISRFPSIGVVGGGISGVAAAVMLPRAGYPDVTVFERNARVAGVWNDNTYPGAACDAPSHLYEFSFAPYPRWSRRYAPQAEIQAYLEDVVRRFGAQGRIRTNTEVQRARWDEDRAKWVQWPWLWSQYRRRTARLEPDAYALAAGSEA